MLQGAVVAINPKTGGVLAWVGGTMRTIQYRLCDDTKAAGFLLSNLFYMLGDDQA
jgi:hypothetical protein